MAFPKFDANCSWDDPHGRDFTNQNCLWSQRPDVLPHHRLKERERNADHGSQTDVFGGQLHQHRPHLRSRFIPHK